MIKKKSRSFVVAMGSVVIVISTATAALAVTFDRTFGDSPGGGYGRTYGSFDFTDSHHYDFDASNLDLCPGDGYGVSMYFNMNFSDGSNDNTAPQAVNTYGCGTTAREVNTVYRQRVIRSARVIGCFSSNGDSCAFVTYNAVGPFRDNPYN